jgi:hypothetical protein
VFLQANAAPAGHLARVERLPTACASPATPPRSAARCVLLRHSHTHANPVVCRPSFTHSRADSRWRRLLPGDHRVRQNPAQQRMQRRRSTPGLGLGRGLQRRVKHVL